MLQNDFEGFCTKSEILLETQKTPQITKAIILYNRRAEKLVANFWRNINRLFDFSFSWKQRCVCLATNTWISFESIHVFWFILSPDLRPTITVLPFLFSVNVFSRKISLFLFSAVYLRVCKNFSVVHTYLNFSSYFK